MNDDGDFVEYFIREKQNSNMVRNRLVFIMSVFTLLFVIVGIKATEVTLLGVETKRNSKSSTSNREVSRSEIIDRNGQLLATNLKTASIYANPQEILDIEEAAAALAETLPDTDLTSLLADLSGEGEFTWVKRNISPKEQKAVNDLGLPGVYFTEDKKRVYPHGNLLAHILGYTNIDSKGIAGIEREFEELMTFDGEEPLQLSIDLKLQHILRDELAKQMIAYDAIGAAGVLLNAQTGETLGMVSLPDFDPNMPAIATQEQKFNRLTLGTYEMGSTFKPFTAAMALDLGTATMKSKYDATKPIKFGRHRISDYHAKKRVLSLPEVIMFSSNIGTAKMAQQVGVVDHKAFVKKLGLLDRAEIEIPEKGHPQAPKAWKEINGMTISFGHGIAVTPVHMAKAFMPMVNGGNMHPITLIKKKPGDIIQSEKIITSKTSDQIRGLLRLVVEHGTGGGASASGYLVGGKTGTAEKITDGKYDKDRLIASFAGAFPMNDPKYIVLAIFDEPKQQKRWVRPTGGVVAAPAVGKIIARMGPSLGIKPQQEIKDKSDYVKIRYQNKNAPIYVSTKKH